YQDGIIPFISSIILLNYNGPIFWYFARLLGDPHDEFKKRFNLSMAEFWKIWVNNIREFDFEGAVNASKAFLDANPRLANLGDYVTTLRGILDEYEVLSRGTIDLQRHAPDCLSVLKTGTGTPVLGVINYSYETKDFVRPMANLPRLKLGEVYEFEEILRYSKQEGKATGRSFYISADEVRHLGFHSELNDWETVIYRINVVPAENKRIQLLSDSLANYKKFGRRDRIAYSLIARELVRTLKRKKQGIEKFRDLLVALLNIQKRRTQISLGTISTLLFDVGTAYPELKPTIDQYLRTIAREKSISLVRMDAQRIAQADDPEAEQKNLMREDQNLRLSFIKLLRGSQIGEIVIITPEIAHIAGLGGIATYSEGKAKAYCDLGIDVTLLGYLYSENREGGRILENVIHKTNLTYTGNNDIVPFFNEPFEISQQNNRWRAFKTLLNRSIPTIALSNDTYLRSLYDATYPEDYTRIQRFMAYSALQAIRSCNLHPTGIETNDGWTGLALSYMGKSLIPFIHDEHFSCMTTRLHIIHNGDRNYHGIATGDNLEHKNHLMRVAGFWPEDYFHRITVSRWNDSKAFNPQHAAVKDATDVAVVSKGYMKFLTAPDNCPELEDALREKKAANNIHAEQNGIDTVTWQTELLRRSFFDTRDNTEREKLFTSAVNLKQEYKKEVQKSSGFIVDQSKPLLTMLHRITPQKGHDIAVTAMRKALNDNPDLQIVVGGPVEKSPYGRQILDELKQLENDFTGRFKFFGPVKYKSPLFKALYCGADGFLMPSLFEPAGLSQLEAIAAGTPVIARNIDGLESSVFDITEKKHTFTGFKFDHYRADDLARTMQRLINVWRTRNEHEPNTKSLWHQYVYNCLTHDSRWIKPAKHNITIHAQNRDIDLNTIADIPELICILNGPEEDLQQSLISFGYTTENGLDHVIHDAVLQLHAALNADNLDPKEKRLGRRLVNKYARKYNVKLPRKKRKPQKKRVPRQSSDQIRRAA
ncbi:MAG: glycosyltransferase, partial [Elusimicrobia bacterium]|nr:glycosyltransferase [Elusimicrobiota bacterium]MBD3412780.1 glycosyltransferase [Elusimicrobiota bacterium]